MSGRTSLSGLLVRVSRISFNRNRPVELSRGVLFNRGGDDEEPGLYHSRYIKVYSKKVTGSSERAKFDIRTVHSEDSHDATLDFLKPITTYSHLSDEHWPHQDPIRCFLRWIVNNGLPTVISCSIHNIESFATDTEMCRKKLHSEQNIYQSETYFDLWRSVCPL